MLAYPRMCRQISETPQRARRASALALGAVSAAVMSGCIALPPPGHFVEWSAVSPISVPADRPLTGVDAPWEHYVLPVTTSSAVGCGAAACNDDEPEWVTRCIEPHASAFARATISRLRSAGHWHPQSFAWLSEVSPLPSDSRTCSRVRLADLTVALVIHAMATQAGEEAEPICRPAAQGTVEVAATSTDVGMRDLPALFGTTLGAMLTLGMATPMSSFVNRVVDLQVTVASPGEESIALRARGAAGISVGSFKMFESDTRPPPELLGVAFTEALKQLDEAVAVAAARKCQAAAR